MGRLFFPSSHFQHISVGAFTKGLGLCGAGARVLRPRALFRPVFVLKPYSAQGPGSLRMVRSAKTFFSLDQRAVQFTPGYGDDGADCLCFYLCRLYAAQHAQTELRNASWRSPTKIAHSSPRLCVTLCCLPIFRSPTRSRRAKLTRSWMGTIHLRDRFPPSLSGGCRSRAPPRGANQHRRHCHNAGGPGSFYIQQVIVQETRRFAKGRA